MSPAHAEAEVLELAQGLLARHAVPGLQVALLDRHETALVAVGTARRRPEIPMAAGTRLQAASLSKPVFATAVLLTAHAGELDIHAPVGEYMRNPPDDHELAQVTAAQCLAHTAGLGAVHTTPLRVHHKPGARFSYSGIGYEYLGRVMRDVWGEPVDTAIQRLVFDPIGVTAVGWRPPNDGPDTAVGYIEEDPVPLWPWPDDRPYVSGSLYISAGDYAKFLRAVLIAEASPFPPAALGQLHTEQARFSESIAWSLGFGIQSDGSIWQWGENPGFHSFAVGYPATGRAVVVMTNSGHGVRLYRELVRELLPGEHPAVDLDDDAAWVQLWQLGVTSN